MAPPHRRTPSRSFHLRPHAIDDSGERVASLVSHGDADLVSELKRRLVHRKNPKLVLALKTALAAALEEAERERAAQ